jgi:predicted HAD superfamily Cof-like phosphohydrolase
MSRFSAIGSALAELRDIHRLIVATTQEQADGWRHELVRRRRDLAEKLGELTPLVRDGQPGGDAPTFDDFRKALSALRTAVAEHQGAWPAVLLDKGDLSYTSSLAKVRDAYDRLETSFRLLDGE